MPAVIEILVSPSGDVTLKTSGFQGSDCLQASRFLETSLGDVAQEQRTSECYQSATQQEQVEKS
jgi:hypothetical protein